MLEYATPWDILDRLYSPAEKVEDVSIDEKVMQMHGEGLSQVKISQEIGMSRGYVQNVIKKAKNQNQ